MLLLSVAFLVLLERILLGRIQLRTRPMNVGWYGVTQTIVDGIKLFGKSISKIIKYGFIILVIIILIIVVFNYVNFLLFAVVVLIMIVNGISMSNNIYSLMGRYRIFVVIIGYDILLLLILLWWVDVIVFVVALFVILCENRRTPIDLIEGESELVSGFNTEYAGAVFVRYFLGEYLIIILLFCLITYINSWYMIILVATILIRGSWPRMKYYEVIVVFWKYFIVSIVFVIVL